MIVAAGDFLLQVEEVVDPQSRLRIERLGGAAHHRGLDRLAHEARLHHLGDRDLYDDRAALRHHLDQARPGERDQRFAHRLARNAVAGGDVLLRQARSRRKLQRHDGAAKLRLDPMRSGERSARQGRFITGSRLSFSPFILPYSQPRSIGLGTQTERLGNTARINRAEQGGHDDARQTNRSHCGRALGARAARRALRRTRWC